MSSGAPLNLVEPASGTTGWAANMNNNLGAINAAIAALQAAGSTGPAGPTGPAGAVGMIYAGPWSSTLSYVVTDAVTFNGSFYIATANNVNSEPDTHPGSWSIIAAAGAAGPAGPTGATGATGPAGSGSSISTPVAIALGGTGATTAAAARTGLGAAASGSNSDITELNSIGSTIPGYSASFSANILYMNGGGGTMVIVPAPGIEVPSPGTALIEPTGIYAGVNGFKDSSATTASAGGGQSVPATILAYINATVNIAGVATPCKIPVFAP